MLTITEMKAEIESILTQVGAMRSQADSESRELTPDEQEKMKGRLDRVDELRNKIELEERLTATHAALDGRQTTVKTDPTDGVDTRTIVVPGEKRYKRADGTYIDTRESFPTFGDQLLAVARHAQDGYTDPRLILTQKRVASGLNESVPHEGGWLVDQEFVSTILEKVYTVGEIARRVARQPIGANKNGLKINAIDETSRKDGYRLGGVQAYWKCEAAEKEKSKPKFRQMQLDLNKLIALVYATDELLDDAVALEGLIKRAMPQEITFKMEDSFIWGTGGGMPWGIMECGSMIAVPRAVASSIRFADILNMWSRLYGYSRKSAVWLINQSIEPSLYGMCFTCGTYSSGPVYLPNGTIAGQMYSTLFGRPVIPIEYCEVLGTAGDIILADFNEYIAIDKGGIEQASSIHVRFIYDEQVFRFVYRVDGQCAWNQPLEPYKGTAASNSQSPFVSLTVPA